MHSLEAIRVAVRQAASSYPVRRVDLFGSYAKGNANENSDVDFLVEFKESPISLFKICGFQETLAELLNTDVDVIESPLEENSDLELDGMVCVYEA